MCTGGLPLVARSRFHAVSSRIIAIAARLESACKQYGAHILISEVTHRQLKGTYYNRELDFVVVKGKTKPVAIYEVLDFHTEKTYPQMMDALGLFKAGLTQYRQQKWADASAKFEEVLALNPNDKAAKMYIERCRHLGENPPGDDWDGVWVMESK